MWKWLFRPLGLMERTSSRNPSDDPFSLLSGLDLYARRQKIMNAADVVALAGRVRLPDALNLWDAEEHAELLAELRSRGFRIDFEPGGVFASLPQD